MINGRVFASLMLVVALTAQAQTPLGEINIELRGNVVDFTCVVEAGDSNKTVQLGRWPTKELQQAGNTTREVPFTLTLNGCPPGAASITFSGTPDTQDSTLLRLNGNSQASNVAVEIRDKDRTRLPLEQASQDVVVDAQGNATLQFFANYIATANDPQPGVADADATFMINYN